MITVLVVDDSAFFRVNLSRLINSDSELKVISTAQDGNIALEKINSLDPDVIILDFELAGMKGAEIIRKIRRKKEIPIIIVSSFKNMGSEEAITSLEARVFDFVEKPIGFDFKKLNLIREELNSKIKAAFVSREKHLAIEGKKSVLKYEFEESSEKIIVIASSTGGPQTLERFIPEIPANIPAAILIVQHMPPMFTKSLAERLHKLSNISVTEAKDGEEIKRGVAYIAPGDYHMVLKQFKAGTRMKRIIMLNQEEREEGVRPSANKLFRSVAPLYRENTIAIVLTGMGADGTSGAKEIKKYNGSVIAQSEKTSIIYGMPKSIAMNNLADEIVDIDKMVVALAQLLEV
jgi:two-component system, chemotaxis family, protein-glutamate methylesterase/glutaminase